MPYVMHIKLIKNKRLCDLYKYMINASNDVKVLPSR